MDLIDLLQKLNIPLWLVLILAVTSMLIMHYYRHFLERRNKKLESQLNQSASINEKLLEIVQERHRKKLEALDEVYSALSNFSHAIDHLSKGNPNYTNDATTYYKEARSVARKYENLLGEKFYNALIHYTNLGIGILDSCFMLNGERLKDLEESGILSPSIINKLQGFLSKKIQVTDGIHEFQKNSINEINWFHAEYIFQCCDFTNEFDRVEYYNAEVNVNSIKEELMRTLPELPSIQNQLS